MGVVFPGCDSGGGGDDALRRPDSRSAYLTEGPPGVLVRPD